MLPRIKSRSVHEYTGALLGAVLLLLVATLRSEGQRTGDANVRGTVRDSLLTRLPYATITSSSGRRVVANDSGVFAFAAPRGVKMDLEVRRLGYRPHRMEFLPLGDTAIEVVLATTAPRLDAVRTIARQTTGLAMTGFYSRLTDQEHGTNSGVFITPEEIERRAPAQVSQLLSAVQGVRLGRGRRDSRLVVYGQRGCQFATYLDGVPMNRYASVRGDTLVFIDDVVSASDLAAVEVYTRGTKAPSQFQSLNGSCGVLLLWTKRGG